MGEMSKLGWQIGLVKHAIGADLLYFHYLQFLSNSKILDTSQSALWLFIGFGKVQMLFIKYGISKNEHNFISVCYMTPTYVSVISKQ